MSPTHGEKDKNLAAFLKAKGCCGIPALALRRPRTWMISRAGQCHPQVSLALILVRAHTLCVV